MRIAIAQAAPVFLNRDACIAKACEWTKRAANDGAQVVCFGEAFIPAYPIWLCKADGARFDEPELKDLHALYVKQAVDIERGDLAPIQSAARDNNIHIVIGIIERPMDRGGHSVFCSAVVIDNKGSIASVHRKLMPTYEERLAWSPGDAHGLVTHKIGDFHLGALNCFENWMPMARTALYAQGEDLHIALWPGADRLTRDITRFIALESRSYVVSASTLIRARDIPADTPLRDRFVSSEDEIIYNGGSAIADPRGDWIVEPVVDEERLIVAEIDHKVVLAERQILDPVGHYSRPELLTLSIDRHRQTALRDINEQPSD